MKKFFGFLLILIIILAGLGYLGYPLVSDQLARGRNDSLMKAYHSNVREMTNEKIAEALTAAETYNSELEEIAPEDPFAVMGSRSSHSYQNILNIKDGILGELVIPSIKVSLPIWHAATGSAASSKLIHLEGTSLPTGQGGTQVILAGPGKQTAQGFLGQIKLTDAQMLEELDQVTPGKLMYLNILDRTFIYLVDGVQTVAPSGLKDLNWATQKDEDRLTVMTKKKGHLLLVQAKRVSAAEIRETLIEEDQALIPPSWQNILGLGLPVLLVGFLVMFIIERIKRRSYRLPTETRKRKKKKDLEIPDEDEPEEEQKEEDRKEEETSRTDTEKRKGKK